MLDEFFDGSLEVKSSQISTEDFKALPACKGIILFSDGDCRPIQLMIGGNIRRTVRSRLMRAAEETASKRGDISEITRFVYYQCCYNDYTSNLSYYRVVRELFPETYKDLLSFGRGSVVKIDLSVKLPYFKVVERAEVGGNQKVFGPFGSRRAAGDFVEILQNAFDLCRRPGLGEKWSVTGAGVSCPYLQMEGCPAVCAGKISMEQYRQRLEQAVICAGGEREKYKTLMQEQMSRAAGKMEYEKAAEIKKRFDEFEHLDKDCYRWTRDLEKLAVLHIDLWAKVKVEGKRKKVQSYKGFLIRYGSAIDLGEFIDENIDELYQAVIKAIDVPAGNIEQREAFEMLSLLSYFLYRSNRSGVWIDCSVRENLSCEKILKLLGKQFSMPAKTNADEASN